VIDFTCEILELSPRQLEDRKIQIDKGRLEKALHGINHIHPAFKILAIRYNHHTYALNTTIPVENIL